MKLGAIEAGGTKFVCAVADEELKITDRIQIPTQGPDQTLAQVFHFFDQYKLDAMGIASFGPIDVNPDSKTYGYITSTPKDKWAHFNFLGKVRERYPIPLYWTTDVNGSAFGEYRLGSAKDLKSCLYLTLGTGVGGGMVNGGEIQIGHNHLELGHIIVRKHEHDPYSGHCPYHGDCLEGLICGPAIEDRFGGTQAKDIPADNPVWDYVAYYLAQALRTYTLTLMPERIIIGGGVMKQAQLLEKVRQEFQKLWAAYLLLPSLEEFIVSPGLGDNAGILGALLLAKESLQ